MANSTGSTPPLPPSLPMQWGDEEDGVMGLGSWDPTGDDTLERSERSQGSESGSEEGESGEWDPRGSVEWDPNEEDDPLSFI